MRNFFFDETGGALAPAGIYLKFEETAYYKATRVTRGTEED